MRGNLEPCEVLEATAITATADGFLAVGTATRFNRPDPERRHGLVWTSPDGVAWTLHEPAALGAVYLTDVATFASRVYLAGSHEVDREPRAALWWMPEAIPSTR